MHRTGLFIILLIFIISCGTHTPPRHYRSAPKPKKINTAGYAIQAGAFSQVKNAETLAGKLQNKGIDAFYFRKPDGIFVVRFGDFSDIDQAKRYALKLKNEGVIDAYYIAPPVDMQKYTPRSVEKKTYEPKKRDDDLGAVIAQTAERFIGIPYKWGGNTVVDGLDCSGFSKAVYNLCGINIPRTAHEQYNAGDGIDKADMDEGDLVFFGESKNRITHVGVYVGNGKMVHAPKRGDDIKIAKISDAYFANRFIGARRYF